MVTLNRAAPAPSVVPIPTRTGVEYNVASTEDVGAKPVTSTKNCWPATMFVTTLPSAASSRTVVPGVDVGGVDGATDTTTDTGLDGVDANDVPVLFVAVTANV